MSLRKSRRLNPSSGNVVLRHLGLGALVAGIFLYGWSEHSLNRMQRRCFPLYVETSAPLLKTVSRNDVRRAFGENIDPRDKGRVAKPPLYGTLHDLVYRGRSLQDVAKRPGEIAGAILALFFFMAAFRIRANRRQEEEGVRLRGPKLMSVKQFNSAIRGAVGMQLRLYRPWIPDWVVKALHLKPSVLNIPEMVMSQHVLLVGDSGVGKTLFNTQMIYEAERLGYTCIINDSKNGKYIQEFYRPERGDIVLNPKDARCPYWRYFDEFSDEPEALTLARSMFPAHPNNPNAEFWDNSARNLLAYISSHTSDRLDCEMLEQILTSEEEIAKRVVGSAYAQLFDVDGGGSAGMRTSVIQTLNQIGYALRMMPKRYETDRTFSIREWAKTRKGWIFLSRTEDTKEAIMPLQSAWLDMILSALLSDDKHKQLVLVSLDELASLNQLPKLHSAITMLRESKNIITLGVQNTAQIDEIYGKQAETIISMCGTKWIGRTSHKKTAEELSGTIGEVEYRLVNRSRSSGNGGRQQDSFSGPVEVRKALVMPSEIQGLPNRQGYLLQAPTKDEVGLHVVHAKLPYFPPKRRHPGVIPRIVEYSDVQEHAVDVPEEPEETEMEEQTIESGLVRLS